MSLQVEKKEKNMAMLTIEVPSAEFDAAIDKAYQKNKGKMNIPGFRKGKAPRNIIEKMYGTGVFYEDAANLLIPDAYEKAAEESGLDIVSQPQIDVTQIEKGKDFIFTAEVAVKPEVKLGEYKGVQVPLQKVEVTELEIEAELGHAREQNARMVTVEDRPSEDGDTVVIDYEGFVDEVAFDGGKAENHSLVLGSHSFIDTFEEQLTGKNAGEQVEVHVTFPEEYHAKELAGKPAVFKVAVKEIKKKELPELDDDFAQDVSDFDTLEEYKKDIERTIRERKEKAAKGQKEDAAVAVIVENSEMDIPDPMINTQVRQMAEDFSQRITSQGLSVEQYFQFTGTNAKTFMESLRPQAVKKIQSRLVLEAVVNAEGIQSSDEEYSKELEQMAGMYQMETEKLKELIGAKEEEQIRMDIAVQKALDVITDAAVEVEVSEEKTAEAETAQE